MSKSIKEKLEHLGFSDYDARAYETLLKYGALSANEICAKTKIPQGRIYSVLKNLESRGFCVVYPGAVKKFRANNPKISVEKLIAEQQKKVEEFELIRQELSELYMATDHAVSPLDYIEVLTSKISQIQRFDDLINRSKSTLYSFNKKPYATGFMRDKEELIKASAPLKSILDNGVSVRAIFEKETVHMEEFLIMVKYYQSLGEEVRICEKLPIKMLLSDSTSAMVSLRNQHEEKFNLTSMVIDHSDLTTALSELFEVYWMKGMTIEAFESKHNKS